MRLIEAQDSSFFDLAEAFGAPKPLRRCLSLMRQQGVATVVLENLEPDDETRSDVDYFASRGMRLERERYRLSFTRTPVDQVEAGEVIPEDYLGYCVIHADEARYMSAEPDGPLFYSVNYIPEAVLRMATTADRLLTCGAELRCELMGQEFALNAALFSQQPGHIGCCAHASLMMVAAQLKSDARLAHTEINKQIGLDFLPELACTCGLDPTQIREVLHALGLKTTFFYYSEPGEGDGDDLREQYEQLMRLLPPQQVIYYAIESGFPALLGFQAGTQGHVIPVSGHVFNGDTWLAEAERDYFDLADSDEGDYAEGRTRYLRSSAWTSHFVAMDDNYGPYYDLPSYSWQNGWSFVIVVTPNDCSFDAPLAEAIAAHDLYETFTPALTDHVGALPSPWGRRCIEHLGNKRVVLRTVWVSRDSYVQQLADVVDQGADTWDAANAVLADLPETFWLVEVSIPELYTTNRMKLADVFVAKEGDDIVAIGARYPGYLTMRENGYLMMYELPGVDHYYPLFDRSQG